MSEEVPKHRAGEMFMSSGDVAVAPELPESLREWRDHTLKQSLRAQFQGCALQCFLKRAGVERLHGGDAFIQECGRHGLGRSVRSCGVTVGSLRFSGKLAQLVSRQFGDMTNAVPVLGDVAQQAQPFNLLV